ncbi:YkyA family protein [Niallia sp. 01092]|uniref:YkyA family protein n=1 Tax=unclassified Niallia TaxID=2837522 RepID=UPI003FD6B9F5
MKQKKVIPISIIVIVTIFLSGCFHFQPPSEKMYEKLEKVVTAEKQFEAQQEPLVTLEKKEQEIYTQIIALDLDKMNEIKKLSDQALASIAKRKEYMNKEEESIKKSKETFETVKTEIEDLKDKELKSKANELYKKMMDRYEVHEELYKNYSEGLKNDEQLYKMFKEKDLNIDDLEAQIKKINGVYAKVLQNNEQFNTLTKEYNDMKVAFYQQAGIEIKVEEKNKK